MSQQQQQPQSHGQQSGYPQQPSGYQQQSPTGHQQQQPQYQATGTGQQMHPGQQGQQMGGGQFGQAMGQRFEESVPNEVVQLTQSLDRLATVAEWVKSRATERGMARLARVCDDIQDVAHLETKLVIRQSPFAQPIGQAAKQVIQQGVQELQQHTNQPEVQQALSEAQQSVNAIDSAITRLQSVGQGHQQQGQQYGQQTGTTSY